MARDTSRTRSCFVLHAFGTLALRGVVKDDARPPWAPICRGTVLNADLHAFGALALRGIVKNVARPPWAAVYIGRAAVYIGRATIYIGLAAIYIGRAACLLYTSDAADEGLGVDLGGRRIIKKI